MENSNIRINQRSDGLFEVIFLDDESENTILFTGSIIEIYAFVKLISKYRFTFESNNN